MELIRKINNQEPKRKIRLRFYPYTYVRANVMRTLLIKKEDYIKMLKMSSNEIASFLQDSTYKKEIDYLGTRLSGTELLESALDINLRNSFEKLRRISNEELQILINHYLKRKDVEDIKTLLRGVYVKADKKTIINSMQGAGTLSIEFLEKLADMKEIEKILENIRIYDFYNFENSILEFKDNGLLAPIENKLDSLYYNELIDLSSRLPKQGKLFKDFLAEEIYIKNLITILRLKKENLKKEEIRKYLFVTEEQKENIEMLLDSEIEFFPKLLSKKRFSKIVEDGIRESKEKNSLIFFETELQKYLLYKSILLLHQHPLTIDVILGYMFAKDIEVRNLKIIIKGKQLTLSEEFIKNQLIF